MGCCGSRSVLTAEEQNILDCKRIRDNIKAYIKRLENLKVIKTEKAKIALIEQNKDKARIILLLARMFSEQIISANNQLNNLEKKIANLEKTYVRKDSLEIIAKGNKTLKELQKEVDVEKYEKMEDDLKEMKKLQEQIAQFFIKNNVDFKEEENKINCELDQLIQQSNANV